MDLRIRMDLGVSNLGARTDLGVRRNTTIQA